MPIGIEKANKIEVSLVSIFFLTAVYYSKNYN